VETAAGSTVALVGPGADEVAQGEPPLWFGKRDGRLKFGPITWQGRAVTFLYLFLVAVAIFTYSQLALTAVVVVFYTVAFSFVVALKSDLMKHWPPGS
jgi:hypothetical protein